MTSSAIKAIYDISRYESLTIQENLLKKYNIKPISSAKPISYNYTNFILLHSYMCRSQFNYISTTENKGAKRHHTSQSLLNNKYTHNT